MILMIYTARQMPVRNIRPPNYFQDRACASSFSISSSSIVVRAAIIAPVSFLNCLAITFLSQTDLTATVRPTGDLRTRWIDGGGYFLKNLSLVRYFLHFSR